MGDHEIEEMLPALEEEITSKGTDIVEESFSSSKRVAQQLVFGIHQVEDGMEQEGQEIE